MKKEYLNTWEEFEDYISQLNERRSNQIRDTDHFILEYLFRGQSNSNWNLETTLERFTGELFLLEEYDRILRATKPQVEALTGLTWDEIPSFIDYLGKERLVPPGPLPDSAYSVYLRHHGFPSPLLDWTKLPYIAAYFAFRDNSSKAMNASIYVYCEHPKKLKSRSSNKSNITTEINVLGPNVLSHPRHSRQKSQYTICTKYCNNKHSYARHEDVFAENKEDQDKLLKFYIPISERDKILNKLAQRNINAYSLFGSEESLMETLSFKEILFRKGHQQYQL